MRNMHQSFRDHGLDIDKGREALHQLAEHVHTSQMRKWPIMPPSKAERHTVYQRRCDPKSRILGYVSYVRNDSYKLGSGTYGSVYVAWFEIPSRSHVRFAAVKLPNNGCGTTDAELALEHEYVAYMEPDLLIGFAESVKGLVMEFATGTMYMFKKVTDFSPKTYQNMMGFVILELFRKYQVCYERKLAYNDMKPANILVRWCPIARHVQFYFQDWASNFSGSYGTSKVWGTPSFCGMNPRVANVSPISDLQGLWLTLFDVCLHHNYYQTYDCHMKRVQDIVRKVLQRKETFAGGAVSIASLLPLINTALASTVANGNNPYAIYLCVEAKPDEIVRQLTAANGGSSRYQPKTRDNTWNSVVLAFTDVAINGRKRLFDSTDMMSPDTIAFAPSVKKLGKKAHLKFLWEVKTMWANLS